MSEVASAKKKQMQERKGDPTSSPAVLRDKFLQNYGALRRRTGSLLPLRALFVRRLFVSSQLHDVVMLKSRTCSAGTLASSM